MMLFITSRTPKQSAKSKRNRKISFNYDNTAAAQYLYFCERRGEDDYVEIKSPELFKRLKALPAETQLLFYIHGFNNNMEPDIFNNAAKLQQLMDNERPGLVHVIPLIWPCDDDSAVAFADDYWDDQDAADASGPAFARLLGKFDSWRRAEAQQAEPCLKRINVLAHSMGNRVLKNALNDWSEKHAAGNMPQLFRNTFMVAADVKNEILEQDQPGRHIVDSSRNVVVYFANDDLSMPASKLANIRNKTLSRRMGMTGPEKLSRLPNKVYEVDCDDFNNKLDLKGHSYFLTDKSGNTVSPIIKHMADAIDGGRVKPDNRSIVLHLP
ncbi:alpha/beta hydrolase [Shewanella waksmanii]|uniref:alpha/beta hydrolase n=1 Tax=Shewanella waksmanii TaxID=213783 RepID=UPI0004BC55AA|nr:alpha/beta hydrolase [Shewanella waksmanii]